jgi:hypothetical protein
MFRRNIPSPCSGLPSNLSKKSAGAAQLSLSFVLLGFFFLLGLLFGPEDEDGMFLRNIKFSPYYTT